MRLTDSVMAFPSLVLAIGLLAVFQEPGLEKAFLVLAVLGWTTIAREVRREVRYPMISTFTERCPRLTR